MRNILQDHFSMPSAAMILTLANDAGKLGLSKWAVIAVLAASCVFSAIQAAHDIGERWLAAKYPSPTPLPK